MPRLSFSLRDVFWLMLVVGCLCAWWTENQRRKSLAMEVQYLKSAATPTQFVGTQLDEAIYHLSWKHRIKIDVDWPSLKAIGFNERTPVTCNLQNGSLRFALEAIFQDKAIAVSGRDGRVVISAVAPHK